MTSLSFSLLAYIPRPYVSRLVPAFPSAPLLLRIGMYGKQVTTTHACRVDRRSPFPHTQSMMTGPLPLRPCSLSSFPFPVADDVAPDDQRQTPPTRRRQNLFFTANTAPVSIVGPSSSSP